VRPDNMRPYLEAGATGFGLGSGVYVPGRSPQEVEERARAYMESVNV